jgi:outer membrane biosynthesis protein TonB
MHLLSIDGENRMEPSVLRRLLVALVLSIGVHGALLYLVRAQPPQAGASPPTIISAWIEQPNAGSDAEVSPAPATANETEPAPATTTPAAPAAEMPSSRESPESPATLARAAEPARPDTRPGLEIPAVRDPVYYPVSALDKLPSLIGDADGCYPMGAVGEVVYTLLIDEKGAIVEATISGVKPVGLFTAAAEEMCRSLKFAPAEKGGRAVRSRVRFVVGANRP